MSEAPWFVSAETASQLLSWPDLIEALDKAYQAPHAAEENPPRSVARGQGTWLRSLAAILPTGTSMGAKLFGLGRNRAVSYAVVLFDQESGRLTGILDGESLTTFRTAATSAVAVKYVMPEGPVRLGVIGSGAEAHSHVRAIAAVRPIERLGVYSPSPDNRAAFAAMFSNELGIACHAAPSAEAAVRGASLVLGAARSYDESPTFRSEWVSDDAFVVSIGSTLPDQREVEPALIARAGIVIADAPHEVMHGTGDFIAAKKAGVDFEDKVIALNALVRGDQRERVRQARLPLFKSVGSALQDVVVAELALNKAKAMGRAIALPEFVLKKGKAKRQ